MTRRVLIWHAKYRWKNHPLSFQQTRARSRVNECIHTGAFELMHVLLSSTGNSVRFFFTAPEQANTERWGAMQVGNRNLHVLGFISMLGSLGKFSETSLYRQEWMCWAVLNWVTLARSFHQSISCFICLSGNNTSVYWGTVRLKWYQLYRY